MFNRMFNFIIALSICVVVYAGENVKDKTSNVRFENWQIGPFVKVDKPVLSPTTASEFNCPILNKNIKFEEQNTFNPAAAVKDGKVYLFYRADTASWDWPAEKGRPYNSGPTCRIAMAYSKDGINFVRHKEPVLYPDNDFLKKYEWPAGIWDPRLIEDEKGTYYMYYNTWNGWSYYRLCVATSKDLIHWEKKGSIFGDQSALSGCVVWRQKGHRKVAAKINGKYWMYYDHTNFIATSDDLINWTPLKENGYPKSVMQFPRPGYYDNASGEPGTAMLTKNGILLMINGLNGEPPGDSNFPANAWSIGQALIDKDDPAKLLKRADKPTIYAAAKWEKEGFSANCTVMHDGMVFFKGQWLLYYGGGDKHIGLAIYKP